METAEQQQQQQPAIGSSNFWAGMPERERGQLLQALIRTQEAEADRAEAEARRARAMADKEASAPSGGRSAFDDLWPLPDMNGPQAVRLARTAAMMATRKADPDGDGCRHLVAARKHLAHAAGDDGVFTDPAAALIAAGVEPG